MDFGWIFDGFLSSGVRFWAFCFENPGFCFENLGFWSIFIFLKFLDFFLEFSFVFPYFPVFSYILIDFSTYYHIFLAAYYKSFPVVVVVFEKNHENSKTSKIIGRLRDCLGDVRGSFSDRFDTDFKDFG